MKNKFLKNSLLILLIIGCIPVTNLYAGNNTTPPDKDSKTSAKDSSDEKVRIYKVELAYANDKVNHGIKGTEQQPYLSPSFNYFAKSGFNTGINASYLFNTSNFDELYLDLGWDLKIHNNITGGTTITRYFYNMNSPQARSSETSNIDLYLQNDFTFFVSRLSFDLDFFQTKSKLKKKGSGGSTRGNDHSFTWENSHEFAIESISKRDDDILITPKVLITAGTQSVYQTYYDHIIKKHPEFVPTVQDSSVGKFALTSFDFVLPVEYEYRKFYTELSMHYVIPENQPEILHAKNYFYFGVAAGFDF